jgi:uncharacterized protein YcgI (DUF1989 family)
MMLADDIDGAIIEDLVVPAGQPWSGVVRRGDVLRLTDLEGQQAVDFLCYNATAPDERYNAADTMKIGTSMFIETGTKRYSDMGRALFTVIEDRCGRHESGPNCRDNFLAALRGHGLGKKDIVANINFFMYVPVTSAGEMAIIDGRSKPGDFIDLRAEMDVLTVLSNCPQRHNPAAGDGPTPIRVTVWHPSRVAKDAENAER